MAGQLIVSVLDYGAGNVQSVRNAIHHLGFASRDIVTADDIHNSEVIVFPGQGRFAQAMQSLKEMGLLNALTEYLRKGRPFFGICLGMQLLFDESEESPGVLGLQIIPGKITRFQGDCQVPQIAWNGCSRVKDSTVLSGVSSGDLVYFVHSYCALPSPRNKDWVLSTTDYGGQRFVSMVQKDNIVAAQFHPEKSGQVGLAMLKAFLAARGLLEERPFEWFRNGSCADCPPTLSAKRVVACLDVRSNDSGDLVVTKGDQYDVREGTSCAGRGEVRNLGKPVELCEQYYLDGADEVTFLNITSFRSGVINDLPMLQVLERASQHVFVPLIVGGGIKEYTDAAGQQWSALQVAAKYFRAGADKVSIGSDAVFAAEEFLRTKTKTGRSSIEQISSHYGAQAVVVSIDPKRVYVAGPDVAPNKTVVSLRSGECGPNGEMHCWWQVTVRGGRECRDLDAIELAQASEALGAGELMVNCIDMDGQGRGYDIPLLQAIERRVSIPVVASSGAGRAAHFVEVFNATGVRAALAAGIFHRKEVTLAEVKTALQQAGIACRPSTV